jgi:hypothetical protein
MSEAELSEPQPHDDDKYSNPSRAKWASYGIILLLLLVVVVTGTAAYNVRDQWWDRYLSYIRR